MNKPKQATSKPSKKREAKMYVYRNQNGDLITSNTRLDLRRKGINLRFLGKSKTLKIKINGDNVIIS